MLVYKLPITYWVLFESTLLNPPTDLHHLAPLQIGLPVVYTVLYTVSVVCVVYRHAYVYVHMCDILNVLTNIVSLDYYVPCSHPAAVQ